MSNLQQAQFITCPTLIIHGEADVTTRHTHSEELFARITNAYALYIRVKNMGHCISNFFYQFQLPFI